jgi:hypothetical protein
MALGSVGADLGDDLFRVGVLAGGLLRVDDIAIDQYLEDAAARGDYQELGNLEFELF